MSGCRANFNELKGRVLKSVTVSPDEDEIIFDTVDGMAYKMYHIQDCCESVTVEDINGELDWLVGSEILIAEESTSDENPPDATPPEYQDSFTWTFYKIATAKGHVVIRWYGQSNGYYSESVAFFRID